MYDELIAVHTIMRRGAELTEAAFARLDTGAPVNAKVLAGTARWLVTFVHHHHESEDRLFWPVLRRCFPDVVADLDKLTHEHETLDTELRTLDAMTDDLRATGTTAVRDALASVGRVRQVLAGHLDNEEPVLKALFPQVPDDEVERLRKAIVAGAPRSGPDLVLGLLEDQGRPQGYQHMVANFPAPVRWLRPLLLNRYEGRKKALGLRSA
jgi:hemerythrin-like domain-containing protein